jgi:hypothetical protein
MFYSWLSLACEGSVCVSEWRAQLTREALPKLVTHSSTLLLQNLWIC